MLGVKSFAAAIIFASTLFTIYTAGPWLETRFFPVVGKLVIENKEWLSDDRTKVYAYFNKIRNCEYIGIAWFRGTQDTAFVRVPLVLERQPGDTSSPNRPIGAQRAGPWLVDIAIEEIETNSFVELSHRCHPFWTTTTEFYP